tara:strand:- start:2084 stop:4648 length:2565 start_codon:yes stop_codon:yes gene_type:complete
MPQTSPPPTTSSRSSAESIKASTPPPFNFNIEADAKGIKTSILNHLRFTLAREPRIATERDWWMCTCYAIRDRMLDRFLQTAQVYRENNTRRLYYLSLEYMMGRLLNDNLRNLGLYEPTVRALKDLGLNYSILREEEMDMGLGNGGLGRLAACFLDSLATLNYPAIGYGIHYEFGLFRQEFVEGHQVEHPDNWLEFGNPWQIIRPDHAIEIKLYGHVESQCNNRGDWTPHWVNTKSLVGVPWDVPIVGHGCNTVNFLRLWESRASHEFDFQVFNQGGYIEAVREKALGETVSKVLYPNDKTESGKELRLVQQYFFAACSLKDILRRHKMHNGGWDNFIDKVAVQLNDTHPAIAVVELMRIFIDEENLQWDRAWEICNKIFGYTNHTLLPEALERWSVPLFQKVLPRHLQLIYEMNERFLKTVVEPKWPGDAEKIRKLSIIEEGAPKMVRMAHIAVIGSHSVNGVAELHTELLKGNLFSEFNELYPERFNNKTNGITPRRWLQSCNPELATLINETIGDKWIKDLNELAHLDAYTSDKAFQEAFMAIKRNNKVNLTETIEQLCGISVSPDALFDVQIKRFHEYKRQHLNLLHILTLYRHLLHNPDDTTIHPRVFIFGGKAAPGYEIAKLIILAINKVAEKVNHDPRVNGKLRVIFLPNYSVTQAMKIIPAADLSEQISTAGKEASGTGNMKLALNGAVTIGTLDGANIEIREEVGDENIFIFGMKVDEVERLRTTGYRPFSIYESNEELRLSLDWLTSNFFTEDERDVLLPLRRSLLEGGDPFMVLADYDSYVKAQAEVNQAFIDKPRWASMAISNTARMGKFSADRTIHEYARDIWNLKPLPVSEQTGRIYPEL